MQGDYRELRAFMAIVDRGNFARAADWLAVSPSALSQTIRRLEHRLGQRLLHRTTRSTRPTEAGQELYDRLVPAFAEIEAAQEDFSVPTDGIRGRLRINASSAGAIYAFGPHLTGFSEQYPAIEVEIIVSERLDDLVASGCDAGVRLGDVLEADVVRLPLTGPMRWIAVASPAYLEERAPPAHPSELSNHRCLNMRWPRRGHLFRWEFKRGEEAVSVAVAGPLCTNDAATRLRAAEDGLGIAYVLEAEAADRLRTGALVEVLADWCPPEAGFYLYYAGNRLVTPPLRALCEFLCAR